jgi:hypothetical protein
MYIYMCLSVSQSVSLFVCLWLRFTIVNIVTGLSGVRIPEGQVTYFFTKRSRRALGPTQPSSGCREFFPRS